MMPKQTINRPCVHQLGTSMHGSSRPTPALPLPMIRLADTCFHAPLACVGPP